jgi:hypothetical protein
VTFAFHKENYLNGIQRLDKPMTWTAALLLAVCLIGCSGDGDAAMPVGPDLTAPTVSATTPSLGTTAATTANVKVLFSEAMDGTTITATSFTLKQGATPIASTVSYQSHVATLHPTETLSADTKFTATMNTSVKDVAGNAMAAAKTWTFTTRIATAAAHAAINIPSDPSRSAHAGGDVHANPAIAGVAA